MIQDGSIATKYFPFKQGYLSVATLRVGLEGIQMTVDGKHVTSFALREVLPPSLSFLVVFISIRPLLRSWCIFCSDFGAMAC